MTGPWLTARTSAAGLKNKIDADHLAILLDESDTAFKSDKEYAEALRNILNSGYRKRGVYSTSVKVNGNWVDKDFSTFCPKAIVGIGNLPDTVQDRSISIVMRRAALSEKVEAFRERDARPELEPIQAALSKWAERLRKDTPGNPSFRLHPDHDKAESILADHDGTQVVLNTIKAQAYDMTLEEYETERDTKRVAMASIQYELARRESDAKIQQANAAFDAEIQRIPNYNKESE